MMENPPRRRPPPAADGDVGREARCASCQGPHPDLQLLGCGCLLHATCLPPSTLQRARDAGGGGGHAPCHTSPAPPPTCPACPAPLSRLRILPLRTSTLEEAAVERDRDGPAEDSTSTSLSSSSGPGGRLGSLVSPTGRHSPGGFGSCAGPSPSARLLATAPPRTYRTGRWSAEESSLVDRLMSWFESGRLPLPNGVRLNEFLCDMLACRTSRLTKKLKNARLSARAYRVRRPGGDAYAGLGGEWSGLRRQGSGAAEREVGRDVQHAQGLFIKGVNGPAWVRSELQFNVSRLWRTHLANFCLQIGFEDVDTTEWFATLDSVDYVLATLDGSNVSARRKRMRAAIEEDAASARRGSFDEPVPSGLAPPVPGTGPPSPDRGVFVGGVAFDRLAGRAAAAPPAPPAERERDRVDSVVSVVRRDRVDSVLSEISAFDGKRVTLRLGMERIDSQGSFAEFLTEDGGGGAQRQEKRARSGSYQLDAPYGEERPPDGGAADGAPGTAPGAPAPLRAESAAVDYAIDRSIDSVLGTSSGPLLAAPSEAQGQFLGRVGDYLTSSACPFQHADLWVPIDTSRPDLLGHEHVGSAVATTAATTRGGVSGVIYGGTRQAPPVRLTNAGYVTARGLGPRLTNSLNEFGMYSKNFSFSPGFGLPGKVYLSRIHPLWEGNLGLQSKETFARVGGARVYGVNTCVCFPVSTPIGTMVVGLYSMARLVRDARVESECMRYLCGLRPEPRWKLTIDVAADDEALQQQATEDAGGGSRGGAPDVPPSPPRRTSPPQTAFLIPPSPQSQQRRLESPVTFSGAPPRVDAAPAAARARGPADPAAAAPALARRASDGVPPLALRDNEDGLAALLRELPSRARPEGGRDGNDPLDSLRAMLSRDPAARNAAESKMVEIVSARFRTHVRSGLGREGVAAGVAADWARIVSAAARFRRSRAEQRRKASPPAAAGVKQVAYASHQISMEGSGNDAPSVSSSTLSVGSLPLAGFQPRPGCETEGARGLSTVEGTGNEPPDELKPPARSQGDVPRVISNQSVVKSEG